MPSERPAQRLADIIENIDRILWSAIQQDVQPLRDACEAELDALGRGLPFDRASR